VNDEQACIEDSPCRRSVPCISAGVRGAAAEERGQPHANWSLTSIWRPFAVSLWASSSGRDSKTGLDQKIQQFAAIFSFDPLRDLRDVTLYGKDQDRTNAVVIVDGQFDAQKILSLLKMNPQYQEIPYKSSMLYRWQQEPKPGQQAAGDQMMYGSICEAGRVVMGNSLTAVQQAVDTMKGQASGTSSGLLNQIPAGQGGVFAQVVATGVGRLVGEDPKAALLKQTESLALTLGETSDNIFAELSLRGQSPEVAGNMTKLAQGLIAMVQLSNDKPQLAELAKKLTVSQADKTTQVRFEGATQPTFEFFKTQWEQRRQRQGQ
jgi:hypothetical protein